MLQRVSLQHAPLPFAVLSAPHRLLKLCHVFASTANVGGSLPLKLCRLPCRAVGYPSFRGAAGTQRLPVCLCPHRLSDPPAEPAWKEVPSIRPHHLPCLPTRTLQHVWCLCAAVAALQACGVAKAHLDPFCQGVQALKTVHVLCRRLFLLVRGIFGFGAIGNYLFAVTLLPLNDTLVLTFTAPIWASILGPFIIVKESASK